MFPRPRILFFIALALAIPTYAVSLIIFYFLFKRPYDSKATSLILATAKNCLKTGLDGELFAINRGAIERVFGKFSDTKLAQKYGVGAVNVNWGVINHPMINGGNSFTLRVTKEGGGRIKIEVGQGEDWRFLREAGT